MFDLRRVATMAEKQIDVKIQEDANFIDRGRSLARKHLRVKNQYARELLAELFGTAFLILIGSIGSAADTLSHHEKGNIFTSNFSWGVAVFFAVLMAGNVSGAHFNPAITVTFAFLGRLPWSKVIPYCMTQVIGAFFGSAVAFLLYYDAINAFDGGIRQIDGPNGTAGIFATYPLQELSLGGAIFDQIVSTACLVIAVSAATDPNNGLPIHLVPFAIALYVTINGFTFGYNAGAAINPARDLGPRIMTALAGWGTGVFSYRNYTWFWIPIVFPIIGGILGAVLYNVFIGLHSPPAKPKDEASANAIGNDIYFSRQSIEFLESLRKRDIALPLVK